MTPASLKCGVKTESGANWNLTEAGSNKSAMLLDKNVKPVKLSKSKRQKSRVSWTRLVRLLYKIDQVFDIHLAAPGRSLAQVIRAASRIISEECNAVAIGSTYGNVSVEIFLC